MRQRRFISLATEQDIETACKYMDLKERDQLPVVGYEIGECDDDKRVLVLNARSGSFDGDW